MFIEALFVVLLLILIGALLFVFWIMMLVDSATRKFKEGHDKIVWVLVNIFAGIIGSLIYYFVIYIKDKNKSIKWLWITLLVLFVLLIVFAVLFLLTNVSVVEY